MAGISFVSFIRTSNYIANNCKKINKKNLIVANKITLKLYSDIQAEYPNLSIVQYDDIVKKKLKSNKEYCDEFF